MKIAFFLMILIVFILGCTRVQDEATVSSIQEIVLDKEDLLDIGMSSDGDCNIEKYETNEHSHLSEYAICNYTIEDLNNTEVIIQFHQFTNLEERDGVYQYSSSHLRSSEGLLSENDYGDLSRFYVNHENDYGGHLTEPGIYYYSLWIAKDKYLFHITSKGSEHAKDYISVTGERILSKFD